MQIHIHSSADLAAVPEAQRAKAGTMFDAWQVGLELRNAMLNSGEGLSATFAAQDKIPEQFIWDTDLERAV